MRNLCPLLNFLFELLRLVSLCSLWDQEAKVKDEPTVKTLHLPYMRTLLCNWKAFKTSHDYRMWTFPSAPPPPLSESFSLSRLH